MALDELHPNSSSSSNSESDRSFSGITTKSDGISHGVIYSIEELVDGGTSLHGCSVRFIGRIHSLKLDDKVVVVQSPSTVARHVGGALQFENDDDHEEEEEEEEDTHAESIRVRGPRRAGTAKRKRPRTGGPFSALVHVDISFLDALQLPHGEGTFWQFIGELSRVSEAETPVVRARISRNVNGMDLNLYYETARLLRQYLETTAS